MLRSQTWAASSLLLPHFCPLVFSFSSLLNSFFRLLTWYPLPGPPFLRPFASTSLSSSSLFVFLDWSIPVSITSGCCPCPLTSPRVLLSWVPYLDSASSTLLASLAYTLFLLRLRSWSCYPRSFAFFESKKFPLSLFSCLSWYLLSRRTVFAFLTQSFSIQFLLFLPLLSYLSRYLLSHHVLAALNSVSFSLSLSFRVILLYLLFILILVPSRPCSSLAFKGTITTSLAFVSCHPLYLLSICHILTFLSFVFLDPFLFSIFFYFFRSSFFLTFIIYVIHYVLIFSIFYIHFSYMFTSISLHILALHCSSSTTSFRNLVRNCVMEVSHAFVRRVTLAEIDSRFL